MREKLEDLKPGMVLEGVVTNVAAFGAFVDMGVHQDGLVHISAMANSFARDPRKIAEPGAAARPCRRGAGRPLRAQRLAHAATARERRQFRRQAIDQGGKAVSAGVPGRRSVLDRRRAFREGDGEVCATAVEMGATAVVRFKVHKGLADRRRFSAPVFSRSSYFSDPRHAAPERFLGVMGMPINAEGEIEAENLTLACRNAVLNMMELLQERGFGREQAYVICSVAVDLRVSNVVDVPNYVVSALLPEAIFN